MKEYQNKIEIAILDDVDSVSGTTITMKSGESVISIFSINNIVPDEQPGNSNGSVFYNQTLNVFTDELTEGEIDNLEDRKVIIKLFYTETGEALMGSIDNPARCKSQPQLEQGSLVITCDTPYPLLSYSFYIKTMLSNLHDRNIYYAKTTFQTSTSKCQ